MKKFMYMALCVLFCVNICIISYRTVTFFISPKVLAAEHETEHEKISLDRGTLTFDDDGLFCVYLEDEVFETEVIRFGEDGLFVLENDLVYTDIDCVVGRNARIKQWKCPYCHYWSDLGNRCGNEDCPTNLWEEVSSPFP